jgi:ribonuclease BN (tRNA processing enzyme)
VSLRLTVVGPAPAYTRRAGRSSSCYLVESGPEALLLDLGQGSFSALAAYRDPGELRAVFVSHLHPDHWVDLVPLRHYLKYGRSDGASVEVHGPAELRAQVDAMTGERDFLADLPGEPLEPGDRLLGPFAVRIAKVTHTDSSFGFRVGGVDGTGVVYSGDCAEEEDLLPLIRPGDVLLCEAAFGAGEAIPAAGHLDARRAARVAAEGGAGRLILTHILDEAPEDEALRAAQEVFQGPVEMAGPGQKVELA